VWGEQNSIPTRAQTHERGELQVEPSLRTPHDVFAAVVDTVPREDRNLETPVFAGFGIDRFRTAIGRACKAAGVPVFSPHDLRHRRATLWHLQGVPIADAAAWLGHSPSEHLATYAHATLVERDELNYLDLFDSAPATIVSPARG
jgi:integrase